ncbi:MAG: hypothetical protein IJ455_07725 [Agathobacter sp.]|nr:hypothetical protein [Agathobacter sp.]
MKKKYYGISLLTALVFGFLFELNPVSLFVVAAAYLFCVSKLLRNQEMFQYETNRFHDINAYMSQMAQSFIYTKDVIQSLEETASCFSGGLMHDTLNEVFEMFDAGKWNIKRAEMEALSHIESRYDCEKLRNLHAFFLNAEEIGGECQKEFKILESMRTAWQGVVESIRIKRIVERNIGAIIYAFFLLVCVIMLHIMRGSGLDIVKLSATQVISTALLLGLGVYFVFMDKRLTKSLLTHPVEMSMEQVEAYFAYLENYDAKRERRKYRAIAVLGIVVSILFLYIKPAWITLAISVCLIFAGFNVHVLIHISTVRTMRSEIAKAFPKWLFDVMLLLQRESVEGAIEKSIETAPPVLKGELTRITTMLSMKPHDPDAYMSFLCDFSNPQINEIMHKLYSLAVGANRDSEVMDVVIEKNIKNLEKSERDSMLLKDSMKSFTWIPFLCAGFGCMGYLVIAIMTSINGIVDLIGR